MTGCGVWGTSTVICLRSWLKETFSSAFAVNVKVPNRARESKSFLMLKASADVAIDYNQL
jgi:hypothetical protein